MSAGAAVRRWDDLVVGLSDSFRTRLDDEALDGFAALSGDRNPLHMSAKAAGDAGFGGRVLHGMLTSSLYSRLVGMHLPGEHALLQAIEVGFRHAAYAGDGLLVSGEIVSRSDAARVITIKASITRDGTAISTASIRVGLTAAAFDPPSTR